MEKKKEKAIINFGIESIREVSYKCDDLGDVPDNKLIEKNLITGIGFRFNSNFDKKTLGIVLSVKYLLKKDDAEKELCSYEIESVFKIKELEKAIKIEGEKVQVEDGLLLNLLSVTIGALRGMLALKTQGTILNKYPLPLVDVSSMIKHIKDKKE